MYRLLFGKLKQSMQKKTVKYIVKSHFVLKLIQFYISNNNSKQI